MGDLKPLGSEKLQGDEKIKRILELTYYNQKEKKNSPKVDVVTESKNGGIYGIVKENGSYYVKKGLNEQSLDYIGGLFMKNKNRFNSYAEALKRMELLKGQEQLKETKYILKPTQENEQAPEPQDAPALEPVADETAPAPAPTDEPAPAPAEEPAPAPADEPATASVPAPKKSDYMAEIQKYAGKIGQELRDQAEKLESSDIKYVLNVIISAIDLNKLDIDDLEAIAKKFEREDELAKEPVPAPTEEPAEEPAAETAPAEEPATAEKDLEEVDFGGLGKIDEFLNSNLQDEIDLSKYSDIKETSDEHVVDTEELKKQISDSVNQILAKHFK